MAKHSFGAPLEEDILEIQGKEYRLQPFGMRAFKQSMDRAAEVTKARTEDGAERTSTTFALSTDLILSSVHEDDREALAAHLEDSVPPHLLSQIAAAIMRGLTDLDPTQPTSSSDGSFETGAGSTDGVLVEESTLPL